MDCSLVRSIPFHFLPIFSHDMNRLLRHLQYYFWYLSQSRTTVMPRRPASPVLPPPPRRTPLADVAASAALLPLSLPKRRAPRPPGFRWSRASSPTTKTPMSRRPSHRRSTLKLLLYRPTHQTSLPPDTRAAVRSPLWPRRRAPSLPTSLPPTTTRRARAPKTVPRYILIRFSLSCFISVHRLFNLACLLTLPSLLPPPLAFCLCTNTCRTTTTTTMKTATAPVVLLGWAFSSTVLAVASKTTLNPIVLMAAFSSP